MELPGPHTLSKKIHKFRGDTITLPDSIIIQKKIIHVSSSF